MTKEALFLKQSSQNYSEGKGKGIGSSSKDTRWKPKNENAWVAEGKFRSRKTGISYGRIKVDTMRTAKLNNTFWNT